MFVINGTDYTLFVLAAVAALVFFAGQYALCRWAKRPIFRYIPACAVVLLLLLAQYVLSSDNRGSFIDLRGAAAAVIVGFALLCAVSASLGWLLWRWQSRKK